MTRKRNQLTGANAQIVLITVWALLAAFSAEASADGWELRTTTDSVPGTREIESGDVDKAIRISEIHLPNIYQREKAAVLNNLCIGYILRGDLGTASDFCEQAVARPSERTVSYNNRGVLKALQGDIDGAIQDFEQAIRSGCLGECSDVKTIPQDLPRPVARRNLARAEYIVNALRSGETDSLKARADQ